MSITIYDSQGHHSRFSKINTEAPDPDKEEEKKEKTRVYSEQLETYQYKLYAENERSLLLIFQGMDGSGKDSVVRRVLMPLSPQGVTVTSFKAPEPRELAHDFLWRVHQVVPQKGYIGVFNRSHYEDVLVTRVKKLLPKEVWKARYDHINAFEKLLADNGTTILKFYLHISKKEQRKRFDQRLEDPNKSWKYNAADEEVQTLWDEYEEAYQDVFEKCSTPHAPWHIIPADNKWYRDFQVAKTIVKTLEKMDPRFPVAK